jgi:hypothetical protein
MKYALLIYGNEQRWSAWTQEELAKVIAAHGAYGAEMKRAGVLRGGAELRPIATATSIRFTTGSSPRTMDGPFAETKEQLGGFYLIEVPNLEQAIAWAEKMPGMTDGTVEIRPLGVEAA